MTAIDTAARDLFITYSFDHTKIFVKEKGYLFSRQK